MLEQPMIDKRTAMRLTGMVKALKNQQQDPATRELSFLERLSLLGDQQWNWRQNQALARRLVAAKLRGNPCVEDIDYRAQESGWVRNHEHVFVLGPTGSGRSFIASAFAQKACRDGYTALYLRAPALFRDLALARADGSLRSLLARLSRIDVLVVDDWAMAPLTENERRDFWEICENRYQSRAFILVSQLPVARWPEQIGDPTVADGVLDRLVHNRSFEDVAAYQTFFNSTQYNMVGCGDPLPITGVEVSGGFLPLLGVDPALGRWFTPEECRKGARPVALLTDAF